MVPKQHVDGETRTSRVVGSVDFVRPQLPYDDDQATNNKSLRVIRGVRSSMPFCIKYVSEKRQDDDDNKITEISNDVFRQVDESLNTFKADSEISQLNNLPANQAHVMSPVLQQVVLAAKEMVKTTRGAFDPTVGPLLEHYEHFARKKAVEISMSDRESVRMKKDVIGAWQELLQRGFGDETDASVSKKVETLLQYSQWRYAFSVGYFDQANHKIRDLALEHLENPHKDEPVKIAKLHPDAKLDLNGIAKGWAVDEIARRLPAPCYVEWGGDIKVRGSHPSGRPWVVGIPEPPSLAQLYERVQLAKSEGQEGPTFNLAKYNETDEASEYLAALELQDGDAVATSGDYEKVIEKDGKLYSHVISSSLGRLLELNPVTLAQSVVVSRSCMFADAFATAAMSKEDPTKARIMLEPFRTGFRDPVSDFLLYSRNGPRIIRMSVPGLESKIDRDKRLKHVEPALVVVVGSGLAGMSAAIEAADAGATVIILEKEKKTGGNSAKATSGINAWGTETQAHHGVADEERLFERDTFRSGKGGDSTSLPSLVRTLSTQSAPAIHWLKKRFNIPLTVLSQLGGHSAKRTHRAPPDEHGRPQPIGYLITKTLKEAIDTQYENIEVRCGQAVTRLLYEIGDDGVKTVTGVEINGSESLAADAVILTTGGFGCDRSENGLMSRFRPDLLGTPTTNGPFAQGDGVHLGEEVGAELIDMDKVQLHPTGFIDPKDPSSPTKYLAPEMIRGSGGILVNSAGKRFVNELDLRSVVAKAIQDHCSPFVSDDYVGPPFAWCILSTQAQELFGLPTLSFYKDRLGLFETCKDVKEAAALIGCSESDLNETLSDYSHARNIGACFTTHKDVFPAELSPDAKDMVLARVTPSVHYTMGGIAINSAAEVQERIDGTVGHHRLIRRLFAAGEVAGGVHGNNRLGGNSLLECCVFGRIAGGRAATVKHARDSMFLDAGDEDKDTNWLPLVLREVRNTDAKYGINTREVRFNLNGALQNSGLDVGQFIGLRGELDGETLMGYFSPITRPNDVGVIGILCRTDAKGGPITKLLDRLRPGSVMYMSALGGLRLRFTDQGIFFREKKVSRIGLLAGGTGIAPMLQIIRVFGEYGRSHPEHIGDGALNLIYAAEAESDLAYMKILDDVRDSDPEHFRYHVFLNQPPLGWTEGVGFVEPKDIKKHLIYPPEPGDIVVMCGPPIFEAAMTKSLARLGFEPDQLFSFSQNDKVTSRS